ncbi:hypothetical protein K7432_012358 [Basidiobolus ranarum]|uniref:Zn(2)-C6 fungal-type domain-containing protein n=1 Tax=Basidiobolus ranarum TaxID=34480 RepID=A0ABR2WKX7_9FUNG
MNNYIQSRSYNVSAIPESNFEFKKAIKPQYTYSIRTGQDDSKVIQNNPCKPKRKRQQVKNACVNCQKACKKCDEGRPCSRCIKYGLVDTCTDSLRKARKKGVKRGPYKRRKVQGSPQETAPIEQVKSEHISPTPISHPQPIANPERAYSTQSPHFLNPSSSLGGIKQSAFAPVQRKHGLPQTSAAHSKDEHENLSLLSYLCQGESGQMSDIRRLLNPQVQTLQCPQPRRFSVDLPIPTRVDLAPRSNSVEPNNHYLYDLQQSSRGDRGSLSIDIPKLPSIAAITSRANQPPTPAPVLPPLKNIPIISYDNLRTIDISQ